MIARTALQCFVVFYVIDSLHASSIKNDKLGILSQLIGKDSKDPLIVVVDAGRNARDSNFDTALEGDRNDINDENVNRNDANYRGNHRDVSSIKAIYDALIKDNYQSVLYDILRTNNEPQDPEELEAQEDVIAQALRSRCNAKKECAKKCYKEEYKKPKKSCKKKCETKFDKYIKCPPKAPPPPPKKDRCNSCGDSFDNY